MNLAVSLIGFSVSSLRQHYLGQVHAVAPLHRGLSAWLIQAPARKYGAFQPLSQFITQVEGCQRDLRASELVFLQVGGQGQMGTCEGLHLLGGPAGRHFL